MSGTGNRQRGGNRRRPSEAKKHTLAARITQETRDALEREAERTGRSMSQVAEAWIEKGRFLQAYERAVLERGDRPQPSPEGAATGWGGYGG